MCTNCANSLAWQIISDTSLCRHGCATATTNKWRPVFHLSISQVQSGTVLHHQQEYGTEASQNGLRLTYLPNLLPALKSHMHSNHKLGYTNSKIGYYSYYQSLLPHICKSISNTFWSVSKLSLQMKRNIFHCRTGTLLNQKHAVPFKMFTSLQYPFCQQADSVRVLTLQQEVAIANRCQPWGAKRVGVQGPPLLQWSRKVPKWHPPPELVRPFWPGLSDRYR